MHFKCFFRCHRSSLLADWTGSLQVLNLVQSYVSLRVPLYVSYVFHSPVGTGGWQHFDLQSELRLTFVYDTAILWKDGIGSPPKAELQGELPWAVSAVAMLLDQISKCKRNCVCKNIFVCVCPGSLYPTSMRINEQGRLVVNFRTKARFRGLFVGSHPGGKIKKTGEADYFNCITFTNPHEVHWRCKCALD